MAIDSTVTIASVPSFNGRTGAITPIQADYDSFFLTPAEGTAAFDALGSAAAAQAASQPVDSDLTAIAALATTSYGRALLTLADAAALRSTASVYSQAQVDAGFQPLDSDLTAIAALTTTSFGRGILALADAAALTALGVLASTSLKGLMSTVDKIRMGQDIDAQADLGFIGDLITTNSTSACNTGAPSKITDSSNPFTAYYVGKRITLTGAGASGAQYVGTIVAVDNAGQVDVTPNISTTVATKICSFGTDNATATTALQTLVNTTNLAFPGTKIVFGRSLTNAYGFTTPVILNKAVVIEGIGGFFNADNGDYTRMGGTRLAWWGTTSDGGVDFGAFITIQPGAGAAQAVKVPIIRDLWFDGRNGDQQAGLYGLRLAGVHGACFDNVGFIDFRAAGLLCNSTAVTLNPAADQGVIRFSFRNLFVRNLESFVNAITTPLTTSTAITLTNTGQNITVSATTMPVDASSTSYAWIQSTAGPRILVKYTGGGTTTLNVKCSVDDAVHAYATIANGFVASAAPINAACMVMDGNTTSNTNCGTVVMMQFTHGSVWGPAALDLRNCDSVEFIQPFINGGSPTAETNPLINRTRKEGVTLAGSIGAGSLVARNNTFHSGDPSSAQAAGITAFGLAAAGTALPFPSDANYWDLMQLGNGARVPICETVTESNTQGAAGAYLDWTPNGGFRPGVIGRALTTTQVTTAATVNVIRGSLVKIPPAGWQVGTTLRWTINMSKSAAGLAARATNLRITAGGANTGGTLLATVSHTGTAVADAGQMTVDLQIVGPLGATCAALAVCRLHHMLAVTGLSTGTSNPAPVVVSATTGLVQTSMTMATFNSTAPFSGPQYIHLELGNGAAEVITVLSSTVECLHPGNP